MFMRPLIAIVTLLVPLYIWCQPDKPLRFEKINGLSQNTVYAVMKDRQGFLWIATANGLNRFDGVEVKVYKPSFQKIPGQMRGRIIRSDMIEDDQERIWFSSDLAVQYFDKRTERFVCYDLEKRKIVPDTGSCTKKFANPLVIKDSLLWLADYSTGIYAIHTKNNSISYYPLTQKDEAGNPIYFMYNGVWDGRNMIWFASKKGILGFDIVTRQWHRFLPGYSFYSITCVADTLYACSGKELFAIDPHNFSFTRSAFIYNDHGSGTRALGLLRRVYKDNTGQLWAGDEAGNIYCRAVASAAFVWRGNINGTANQVTHFPVYCIAGFDDRNLWVGGDVLGLQKADVSPEIFHFYPSGNKDGGRTDNYFVHSIYEDAHNNVWLGLFQQGILCFNRETGKANQVIFPYNGPQLFYARSVPLVKADSRGNLWTSMAGQFYVKEAGASRFVPVKVPVPSNALQVPQMWSMAEYHSGWLAGTNIGLYCIVKEKEGYTATFISRYGMARIAGIWVHNNKELWIAPESGGIFITDSLGKNSEPKWIFRDINVKSFYHDSLHQLLWISGTSGLIVYHLPTGKFKSITEENGLISDYVCGVLPDGNDLWVSTNRGLSKIGLQFHTDDPLPYCLVTSFTSRDGLPADEFNTGAFYKGPGGLLYLGTSTGVTWFDPSNVRSYRDTPVVRIIRMLVNEQPADNAMAPEYIRNLSLPWWNNNLFFRFRGIEFKNAEAVKYMYKLEGWDKDWIYSKGLNEVRYNHLSSGKYIFRVKAANQSGIWNTVPCEVFIDIHPPFWRTWWFYTIAVLLFIGSIVLATRRIAQRKLKQKIAALEKQRAVDKERQRISREMHDDIGAGLTQIILLSESAKDRSSTGNEKELSDISNTGRQLVSSMSEIIWSLHPESKTLEQLLSYMREALNKQLEYAGIDYRIVLPEGGEHILLSNEQLRNILLVIKETVNNAIKHSQAGVIIVSGQLFSGVLHIEVTDNGIGFNAEKSSVGNGLRNIRQRTAELRGQVTIESEIDLGSRFIYRFPLNTT